MRAALGIALVASLGAGCAGRTLPPVVEVVTITCPKGAPPRLYDLPPRREEFVTPEDYEVDREVLEGRHRGFEAELGAWRKIWTECPGRDPRDGRP